MNIKSFVQRYPLAAYFSLAFIFSWGGVLLVAGAQGFHFDTVTREQTLPWALVMIAGPCLASILLTGFLEGKEGLRELLARMVRWRVGSRWWVVSVFTNPLLVLVTLSTLTLLVSRVYQPGFNPLFFVFGVMAGFFEEIGWTGFATPRIQGKSAWIPAAIGLGLVHGFWHMLADFMGGSAEFGPYWLPYFLVFWVGAVAAYRVLMVWVYRHTGSLLLGILMHTFFTGGFFVLMPTLTPADQMLWGVYFTASLWFVVGILAVAQRRVRLQASLKG